MARRRVGGWFVALDLTDHDFRVVEANVSPGGIEVTALGRGSLPEPLGKVSPEDAGRAIREALSTAQVSSRQVIVSLPRHLAILKPLVMPPMAMHELSAAVRLQAERELPYSVEDAHLDFAPTGIPLGDSAVHAEEGPGGMGLFLGALKREVVQTCLKALREAGLTPRRLALRPYATATALVFAGVQAGQDEYVGLVDLGDEMTDIDIVRNQRLVFSRSAGVGVGRPVGPSKQVGPDAATPAAESGVLSLFDRQEQALVGEVRRSLEAFAVQPGGGPVSRLYLTGTGAGDVHLAAALAEELNVPVAAINPLERVQLSDRAKKTPPEDWPAYATVLGLVVSEQADLVPGFDFLVPIETRMRPVRSKRPLAAVLGAAAAAALLIGGVMVLFKITEARLAGLLEQQAELEAHQKRAADLERQAKDLDPWTDPARRLAWRLAIHRISRAMPPERRAYVSRLYMQENGTITLDGRAENDTVVAQLTDALKHQEKDFGPPDLVFQRNTGDSSDYPVAFQIKIQWRGRGAIPLAPPAAGSPETGEAPPPAAGAPAPPAASAGPATADRRGS